MNVEQLKKNVGQIVLLRPHPVVVERAIPEVSVLTSSGPVSRKEVVKTDYEWRIEAVGDDKSVTLHCSYTGHRATLRADNVREYRTPNFLLLKCQLTLLHGTTEVGIDPLP